MSVEHGKKENRSLPAFHTSMADYLDVSVYCSQVDTTVLLVMLPGRSGYELGQYMSSCMVD